VPGSEIMIMIMTTIAALLQSADFTNTV